jgi:hypothetical protein
LWAIIFVKHTPLSVVNVTLVCGGPVSYDSYILTTSTAFTIRDVMVTSPPYIAQNNAYTWI